MKTGGSQFSQIFIFLLMAMLIGSQYALADTFAGSVAAATGGTGRATVVPGDSSFLNPATLPYLKGYYFYSKFGSKDTAIGLSDNTNESIIPAAFSYFRVDNLQDFKLSIADYIVRKWTVAASAHYYQANQSQGSLNNTNFDLSFAYAPRPHFGFGLVFYNMAGETKDFPESQKVFSQIGMGATYIYKEFFRTRFDLLSTEKKNNNFQRPTFMLGFESYLNRWMLIRFGYRDENAFDKEYATAGIGFDLPRFKLNYGYEGDTKDASNSRHSVDLAVPF